MTGIWNSREPVTHGPTTTYPLPTRIVYCYRVQAWVVGDQIAPCEHPEAMPGCYACNHAGEIHDVDCSDCH